MSELRLLRAWCAWNSRSRTEYLDAILRLPKAERRKDRGASWGSIQDIYLHVIEDYIWWFGSVQGQGPGYQELVGKDLSARRLRELTTEVAKTVQKVMSSASESDLGRPVLVSGKSGEGRDFRFTTCLADVAWHMVEEELQHRGEINALMWQIDVDPPLRAWFSSGAAWTH